MAKKISIKISQTTDTSSGSGELPKITQDKDGNGLPDLADQIIRDLKDTSTDITVNGKKYSSWDEVPPKERQFIEKFNPYLPPSPPKSHPSYLFSPVLIWAVAAAALILFLILFVF